MSPPAFPVSRCARLLMVGVFGVVSGCVPRAPLPMPQRGPDGWYLPEGVLPLQERLGEVWLGMVLPLDAPGVAPVPEQPNTYTINDGSAPAVGYLPVETISVALDDVRRVTSLTYTVRAMESATVDRSELVVELLCAFHEAPLDTWSPSPLGTPVEGEVWDPLYETYMECTGVRGGVEVSIRGEFFQDSISEFSTVSVTRSLVSLEPVPR